MNLSHALVTAFIHTNVILGAGSLAFAFLLYAIRHSFLAPSNAMKITHSLIVFIVLLPATICILPGKRFFEPTTQIWSAPSMHEIALCNSPSDIGSFLSVGVIKGSRFFSYRSFDAIIILGTLFGLFVFPIRMVFNTVHIQRTLREAHLFRVIGKVRLYASEHTFAPFSIWLPGRSIVVVPTSIIGDSETFSISIAHELHHHRQKDTIWVYALQMLKSLFFWNPLVYWLVKNISEIQEISCDAFMIAHRKISPRTYSRCLVRVAELACQKSMPLCTIGMPASLSGKKLKRRMDIMLANKYGDKRFGSTLLCATLCFCFIATSSFASQGLVRDRRISLEAAIKMAEKVDKDASFPIVVNDSVLIQLNAYLGTPDGRAYMREALSRMETHRAIIEKKLSEYGAPKALMAVPLVESGYRNIPQGERSIGAGLWQFISSTAKHYGLKVDDKIDERLDVEIETDAAVRYLMANNFRFRDWGLSLLAYNAGGKTIQNGIDATGSRDPWTLIQAGYENDKDYLSKVVAAIIIMCNPSSLE